MCVCVRVHPGSIGGSHPGSTLYSSILLPQEEVKSFIQRHLIGKYDFAGVSIERATIECSSNSEFGIFKASLQGRNAKQLIAQIQRSGASHLTLENGQTLTLQACTKECVLEDSVTPRSLSKIGGGIIAATFIFVVLAGLILLLVILVRYRR